MIVLALDTAGTGCFAAVYDSDRDVVLAEAGADIGRGHAERLMAFIDEALAESGKTLGDVDRIAVTVGPGSFTGIRVGVAAARGFALALAVPAVGISSLAVLAKAARQVHQGQAVFAVMDAKRDEIYGQMFDAAGAAMAEAQAYAVDEARHLASGFDGVVCGSARELLLGEHVDADAPRYLAEIGVVARLGAIADPALGKPTPLYLRGPDAKPQLGFAVARA
jgi:tRNA threonylcarbamoyladenosine biosynthesis protein TsaB